MKALIFGGSSGIGKAIASRICRGGGEVFICSRNSQKLATTVTEINDFSQGKAYYKPLDLSDSINLEQAIQDILKIYGTPDSIVLNGGGPPPGNFEKITYNQWEKSVFENFLSYIMILKLLIPSLQPHASVIFILSDVGRNVNKNLVLSSSLRLGLVGLMKCLAIEYANKPIRFNAISLGPIATQRTEQLMKERAENEGKSIDEITRDFTDKLPMQRMGYPEEIAEAAYHLLSKQSSYTSGTNLIIDGAQNTFPG
jgi:3-oxoacyl-[acyl-carrier protein] reductase